MKKILLSVAVGLLTATSSYAAESKPVNYYQDAHGNFIAYTHFTENSLEYDYVANIFRDTWSSLMDAEGNLFQGAYPRQHVTIPTDKIYYKSTDCSGTGYFGLSYDDIGSVEPFEAGVIKNSNNKYISYKVKNKENISSESTTAAVLSFSTIDSNGALICKETPYSILDKEIQAIWDVINAPDYVGDLGIELSYLYEKMQNNTYPKHVVEVLDQGTNITNAHSWMGFRNHEDGTVTGYVKGIDYDAGIEFVDVLTPAPDPEELTYVRTSHDLNVRVQSKGTIGSVSVNKGSDIKLSQLYVEKISAGIFEVTIPESFLPKNKAVRHLQLQCSNNVGASSLIPNTSIGCYKVDRENKIRVTTTRNEKYYSTDFSLNIAY